MSTVEQQQSSSTKTTLTASSKDNNNKNVCFDNVTGMQEQKWLCFAPMPEQAPNMAEPNAVKDFVSWSLELLPPTSKERTAKICNIFHSLCTKARNKQQTLKKFDDAEYIPQSAKMNFALKSNKRVKDTKKFKTQAATIKQLVCDFGLQLKAATKVVTT